jgi:hypothetical protein
MPIRGTHNVYAIMLPKRSHYAYTTDSYQFKKMEKAIFRNIRSELIREIEGASNNIKIAVAWFTNHNLFDALCEKLEQKVIIDLIIIDDFINNGNWGLDFQKFIELGGNLYYGLPDNPMHHKFCIIDDKVLFNGSYNWTYYAETRNFENVIKISDNDELIQEFKSEYETLKKYSDKRSIAVKRELSELELINYFSIRSYLGNDLLNRGIQTFQEEYFQSATQLLPKNKEVAQEYKKYKEIRKSQSPPNPIRSQTNVNRTTSPPPIRRVRRIKRTNISLGIDSIIDNVEGRFSIIVAKGTIIPCTRSGNYYTTENYQTEISVDTYKGEQEFVKDNLRIGSFTIKGLPKKLAGQAGISVTISINGRSCNLSLASTGISAPIGGRRFIENQVITCLRPEGAAC